MARRTPTLVAAAALVLGGVVTDRTVDRPVTTLAGADAPGRLTTPVMSGADAVSSTWFCPGGETAAGSPTDTHIVLANTLAAPVAGRLRVAGVDGEPTVVTIEIAPLSRQVVRLGDHTTASHAGALVELDGGGVVVEQEHRGPLGDAVTPCASAASDEWFLAEGVTAKDASMQLVLFNPFPDDAIADLSFATDQGRAVPADFQGVVVPAGRVKVVDVGSHVRRREAIASRVRTRTGRIVVGKLQTRTAPGRTGLSATMGAPAAGDVWAFPDGIRVDGASERIHVFNPGRSEAAVDVELTLDQGAVEPFELTVPPGEQVVLDLGAEERLPKDVPHAIVVRSVDGGPVVAERVVESAAPRPRAGRSAMLGARLAAERWVTASGSATDAVDQWLVVTNPGRLRATLGVRALVGGRTLEIEGMQALSVAGGRRLAVRLGDHIQRQDLALVVDADRAVVVERGIFRVGGLGMSASSAVPVSASARLLG